jgi:membrane protease YdiL (CAAX protease family)
VSVAPARWGAAATIAWAVLVIAVLVAVQTIFAMVYAMSTMRHRSPEELGRQLEALSSNGDIVAVGTILAAAACTLVMIGIVKLKRGARLDDYFSFEMPPTRVVLRWLAYGLALMAAYDLVTLALGKPIVPEFSRSAWNSTGDRATLAAAIIIVAPIFEELLFRGFLMAGLAASHLGERTAIVVSAVAWAVIHLQYDLYALGFIVLVGLLLGYARQRTGSLAVPVMIHMLVNAVSTVETVLIPP